MRTFAIVASFTLSTATAIKKGGNAVASTAPTYTHGAVASGGSSFGTSSCPVKCKSDGKTIQVFHSTNHGTGLDDTSVHSPSNVIPHTCAHNVNTNACECTCKDDTTTIKDDSAAFASATNAAVFTLAGLNGMPSGTKGSADGTGSDARFNHPNFVALYGDDGALVTDMHNQVIRLVQISTGRVTTFAGTKGTTGFLDGVCTAAKFWTPSGIAVEGDTALVADSHNNAVRHITLSTCSVTSLAGDGRAGNNDGVGAAARFWVPQGIAMQGDTAVVADHGNSLIRHIKISTGRVSTLAGSKGTKFNDKQGSQGFLDGVGGNAMFKHPQGITMQGDTVLLTDYSNHAIRAIKISTGRVTTLAGGSVGFADGVGSAVKFNWPYDIAMEGDTALIVDGVNQRLRRVKISTGRVITLAGGTQGTHDGTGSAAQFNYPRGIGWNGGATAVVADNNGHNIRLVTPAN